MRRNEVETRVSTLENDAEKLFDMMDKLVEQNEKYSEYLDDKIESEREFREFKLEVWKKVVSTGVLGVMATFIAIVWYSIQSYVKTGGQ